MALRSFLPSRFSDFGGDPFTSISRAIQRSLEDAWQGVPSTTTEAAAMPVALDVSEDDKAYRVTAELPGLSEKDVDVSFDDGILTIRGEKKVERDEEKDTWHIVERSYGSFQRRLALSNEVDQDKIDAKFEKGVLNVTLPKLPEAKKTGKKIEVKTA
ncbi:MAG: Hsp20/alpha crystallin family protein [Alphaproteobacteria bacterium]|nr:Hsp20/alpha crystallin family protein [Alphaproteobacteria bacterium]